MDLLIKKSTGDPPVIIVVVGWWWMAVGAGARRWKEMDAAQKAPWMWLGKQCSDDYEQAKSRRAAAPKPRGAPSHPAKPATKPATKAKVTTSVCLSVTRRYT